ncbi:MAG TPA: signal recognition particle-docking protein FtsY [Verrucomicrobiae bacterium]|nr:signal recognition particle-docking protein FtsY [Verrucomicrobiae bacterium]
MNLFQKFRDGLKKTSTTLASEIKRVVTRSPKLDAEALDELEAVLISTDVGVDTATRIIEQTKEAAKQSGEVDVFAIARAEIEKELVVVACAVPSAKGILPAAGTAATTTLNRAPQPPTVILLAGVNGTGKTTSAAKLAHLLKEQGNSVLLAACDTFRAAAIEQLKIWGERVDCEVIAGQYGADSAAIAYDALEAAMKRGVDYLLIDTAGRLHTKKNLMEEMKKMHRSLQKKVPTAPHEVLLVLDATTGSNALNQAREFHQALGVTGLIVTKLDGTAKGGIVVAIARELKIPVKFIGLGEQIDDLQPFDPKQFAKALFGLQTP